MVITRYRLEKLRQAGKLPAKPLVIKTQVTTELITRITESGLDSRGLFETDLPPLRNALAPSAFAF